MNKPLCVVSCPIDTFSGYGARSRDFVRSLIKEKGEEWNIKILAQRWGDCPFGFLKKDDPELKLLLNNYKLINKNKTDVIIWGAGDSGRSLLKEKYLMNFFNYEIKYFVDKKKDNLLKYIDKFKIESPETIINNNYKVLIASTAFYGEIRNEFFKIDNNPKRLIENLFL